jgi:hypothetical protein
MLLFKSKGSEFMEEWIWEEFLAQLRKMVYGDQYITIYFINYIMNQIQWKYQIRSAEMAGAQFQKAGAVPFQKAKYINQKVLDE